MAHERVLPERGETFTVHDDGALVAAVVGRHDRGDLEALETRGGGDGDLVSDVQREAIGEVVGDDDASSSTHRFDRMRAVPGDDLTSELLGVDETGADGDHRDA